MIYKVFSHHLLGYNRLHSQRALPASCFPERRTDAPRQSPIWQGLCPPKHILESKMKDNSKLLVIMGPTGSGMYIRALLYGLDSLLAPKELQDELPYPVNAYYVVRELNLIIF